MKKQNGFALVPILLILILLSVVGFTGYYVYNQQTSKKTDSAAAVSGAAKTTPTPVATSTPTPSPKDMHNYLIIKEWGVKLYAEDPTTVLEYKINDYGIAEIRSNKLNAVSRQGCTDNSLNVARGRASEHVVGENGYSDVTFKSAYENASVTRLTVWSVKKQIGDYYYVHPFYPGAGCVDDDKAKMETQTREVLEIVKNINSSMVSI